MPKTSSGLTYAVRESSRAKRVIIKVRMASDVEVVIPSGFPKTRLPEILDRHARWIAVQRKKFQELRRTLRPKRIALTAIGQTWKVQYITSSVKGVTLEERDDMGLTLTGHVDDLNLVVNALNAWIHKQARSVLGKWLSELSDDLAMPFNKLTVRRQKSLWGSCSAKKNINLNRNLLFLSKSMARYVLIHELCHTEQLNHSNEFWIRLEKHVKNSKTMSAKAKQAGEKVPVWAKA
ncbi:M48 family metallopeptidase [SAR202 cluster bacterium AD-802-F09_MRT_200m]|nr:M48 family metallopeptidase [SAR202 cluster bacterium AD-802-F09_MRT_200m]